MYIYFYFLVYFRLMYLVGRINPAATTTLSPKMEKFTYCFSTFRVWTLNFPLLRFPILWQVHPISHLNIERRTNRLLTSLSHFIMSYIVLLFRGIMGLYFVWGKQSKSAFGARELSLLLLYFQLCILIAIYHYLTNFFLN